MEFREYIKCTICGGQAMVFRLSNHKFRIKCSVCGCHTRWASKRTVMKDWKERNNVKI